MTRLKNLWRAALAVPLAVATVVMAHAQGTQANADSVSRLLTSASLLDRGRAISLIREHIALAADPGVKRALKSEIGRVISDARRFQRERNAAPEGRKPSRPPWIGETGEGQAEYDLRVQGLVAAVGDPDFIPELTWFVGTNAKAIDALAGFGSSALPLVLQRHADPCFAEQDCPPGLRDGLLQTLAAMVTRRTIAGAQDLGRIKTVGLASLKRADDWESIAGGMAVAAALCDPDLRQEVAAIAFGPRRLTANVSEAHRDRLLNAAREAAECEPS